MKTRLLSFFLVFALPILAPAETLKISTDNDWYPNSYTEGEQSVGVQIDIVREALKKTKYTPEFIPCPWKRCLLHMREGEREALVTASYTKERAEFMIYPPDATTAKKSKWRVNQVEYVLMTRKGESYEFDGNLLNIPQPIGAESGSSTAEFLKENNLTIIENVNAYANSGMLALGRLNSVVAPPLYAKDINVNSDHAGKFKIHKQPLRSKSYFMAFSKKGKLSASDREKIWAAIAEVRSDEAFMLRTLKKHKNQNRAE